MKDIFINLLFKMINVDSIAKIMAKCITFLLEWARGSASEDGKWDKAKEIIEHVNTWSGLFLEVYTDDRLTADEEERISEAIKNCTDKKKIDEILNRIQKKSTRGRKPRAKKTEDKAKASSVKKTISK